MPWESGTMRFWKTELFNGQKRCEKEVKTLKKIYVQNGKRLPCNRKLQSRRLKPMF